MIHTKCERASILAHDSHYFGMGVKGNYVCVKEEIERDLLLTSFSVSDKLNIFNNALIIVKKRRIQ